ncbi:hypothetical protein CN072_28675 [Sinorhizobium meliloti]|nr:hypothetical protein CN072_28675 [Sinorhizobium meliloti]
MHEISLSDVSSLVGQELGTSKWITIDQAMINLFAGLSGILCGGPVSSVEEPLADSDEAAPLFRDDCAPGFRDDLAPCLVGSAGDDCCQFIQARCQALRGRFRRRLSPLNSMRWALWTNLSSMASA